MPAIVNIPGGPIAANTTPVYTGQIVDGFFNGIPAVNLNTLTLSIVDTLTGLIVNSCYQVNILNTGRGTVDSSGNLTITLLTGDTSMDEVPGAVSVQRSLVIDWTYNSSNSAGRHQANFIILALAGP